MAHSLRPRPQTQPPLKLRRGKQEAQYRRHLCGDIGMWNLGAYSHGMMGRTPNIDSIAKDGILFTDHYGQPGCTAGLFRTDACAGNVMARFRTRQK